MQLDETGEFTMAVARKGYESYSNYTGWKSAVTGSDLPQWENLPGGVVNAWFAAADGMIKFLASHAGKVEVVGE